MILVILRNEFRGGEQEAGLALPALLFKNPSLHLRPRLNKRPRKYQLQNDSLPVVIFVIRMGLNNRQLMG